MSGGGVYVVPEREQPKRDVVVICSEHGMVQRFEGVRAGQMVPICCSRAITTVDEIRDTDHE